MSGTVLERSLCRVIARLQKLRILRRQTVCWLLLLLPAIAATLLLPVSLGYIGPEVLVLFAATILGTILSRLLTSPPTVKDAARIVEQKHPELNDAILTAVQISQRPGRRPSVLSAMALQEADQLARQCDWSTAVSGRRLAKWTLFSFLSFVVMVSSVMAASRFGAGLINPKDTSALNAQKKLMRPVTELVIEPGDTEIERGSSLTVVAKFPAVVPTHAVLEFTDSQLNVRQLTMAETVDAGVFAARMEEINGDGTYRVLFDNVEAKQNQSQHSPEFKVMTYVRPKLEQVDAVVTPPAWSGRPQETIEDVMRMTVTEGSTVLLKARLNKAVAIAELHSNEEIPIRLTPNADDQTTMEASLVVSDSNAWVVHLEDADGRTPKDEKQISIKVSRNERAKLKVTFPGKDTTVSALQEFLVEATASDDFGIVQLGVEYSLSGAQLTEQTLNSDQADSQVPLLSTNVSHQIELETLNAAPDDLVAYSFWASDIGPDGDQRRTYSDIMFAEVRRFEEIFRESQQQGQQPQQEENQQQQQQQGSAVDGVLKLQKEIISATWNMSREEADKRKDGSFATDVGVIAKSQGQAVEQLEAAMQEMADDPKLKALGDRAIKEMKSAAEKLADVQSDKDSARLAEAMPIEQTIVKTLLQMRAAEFQVQQQQQAGGGGGSGGSASQQQLQQLELDNKRNRYETEQQAQQQQEQTQQQREQVQVLNRLKELARRQQMVNARLKQLESELRAATSEEEQAEIERELKRLRDEQREMLRDVDELSERMEQATDEQKSESAQKQQEMKQQLEQARENVQQASRAMDAGNLAEAISEGTRAERQFEELKEDFRAQTSSQFDEAVRDLRDQARELSDQQEKLAQKLAGNDPDAEQNPQPSLRPDRNREPLQNEVAKQRERLNRVVDQTKQMIEQAEETEPLLSNKLYETLRDLKDLKPDEALEATELLTSRGMWSQSQQAEQAARKGIEQLKDGIEKAADSVLGSEIESLRRAHSQLSDATEKLASEVKDATGNKPRELGDDSPSVENTQSGDGKQPGAGKQPGDDKQPGAGKQSGNDKQPGEGQTPGQDQQSDGQNDRGTPQSPSLLDGGREGNNSRDGVNASRPLTGNKEFTEWSDQLRDIEEMLEDPELRNRVAQVRDRAKAIRAEFKRHGEQPQWDLVKSQLLGEMQSLQQRIAQELAKRDSDRPMVPIDREPVPEEFDSLVQRYYELLGRERDKE